MSFFVNGTGKKIFWESSEINSAHADVLVLHGMSEHSGRYLHLIKDLNKKGFNAYRMDHVGHGKSEGERGKIESFQEYIDDVDHMIRENISSDRPLYIYAHSMGSLVSIHYVLQNAQKVKRLAITGTCLFPGLSIPPVLVSISKVLTKLWPSGRIVKLKSKEIAKSVDTQNSYNADPLISRKPAPNWTGLETLNHMISARDKLSEIKIPIHIQHGSADRIVDPKGSQHLYDAVSSERKELIFHDGYRHEVMNEEIRPEVVKNVLNFFSA